MLYKLDEKTLHVANFIPIGDRILVNKDPETKITDGGLYIPDTVWEKRFTGTVLAVGNGYSKKRSDDTYIRLPLEVKVGDRVSFMHYVGHPIKIEGQEYMLLKETDLLGVLGE